MMSWLKRFWLFGMDDNSWRNLVFYAGFAPFSWRLIWDFETSTGRISVGPFLFEIMYD